MTTTRFGRAQRMLALVPLGIVSAAWTASLIGVGGNTVATAADSTNRLPDGTTVPTQAIEDPANFTQPGSLGLGIPDGSGDEIVQAASTNGIPSAALSAYQRAATVINAADKSCGLPWELVAAIGRVESDHGRYGNNTLGKDGVSRPGIYGIALNGKNNTARILDTDAGQYDSDAKFDRAIGPMQFIPATWATVGVDADGDGDRNPQDIDDAALAAAVYLCSGKDDLSTDAGQRSAVYRYNHSQKYVDLVLRITRAYQDGNFTSVPNNTTAAVTIPTNYNFADTQTGADIGTGRTSEEPRSGSGDTTVSTDPDETPSPTTDDPTPNTDDPADDPTPGTDDPADDPVNNLKKGLEQTGKKVEEATKQPVEAVLSLTDALNLCNAQIPRLPDLLGLGIQKKAVDRCAQRIEGTTEERALGLIPNTVLGIQNWLGL